MSEQNRWASMKDWDACGRPVDTSALQGQPCYVGIYSPEPSGISAMVAWFPSNGGRKNHQLLCKLYAPPITNDQHAAWAEAGYLALRTGTNTRQDLNTWALEFDVREVAVDCWTAGFLTQALTEDGYRVAEVRQGFVSLSAPTKHFKELILRGELDHGANPIMRLMAGSLVVDTDAAGNVKPSTENSTGNISGIMAAILALSRAMPAEPDNPLHGVSLEQAASAVKTIGASLADTGRHLRDIPGALVKASAEASRVMKELGVSGLLMPGDIPRRGSAVHERPPRIPKGERPTPLPRFDRPEPSCTPMQDAIRRLLREHEEDVERIRHGDITIKVQDGKPVLVEITTKHKPQT